LSATWINSIVAIVLTRTISNLLSAFDKHMKFFHTKSNKCVESITQHGEFSSLVCFRRSIESVDFTDYLKCN